VESAGYGQGTAIGARSRHPAAGHSKQCAVRYQRIEKKL